MKHFNITVNGTAYDVHVEELAAGAAPSAVPAAPAPAAAPAAAPAPAAAAAEGTAVESPMPGTILNVCVSNGASVKAGDVLVVLEAMKMENEIKAAADGTVTAVHVRKGDSVESGSPLVTIA